MAQEICVVVSGEDRAHLEAIIGDRNRPLKHVQRARIILLSAERLPVLQVARGRQGSARNLIRPGGPCYRTSFPERSANG